LSSICSSDFSRWIGHLVTKFTVFFSFLSRALLLYLCPPFLCSIIIYCPVSSLCISLPTVYLFSVFIPEVLRGILVSFIHYLYSYLCILNFSNLCMIFWFQIVSNKNRGLGYCHTNKCFYYFTQSMFWPR
jgi:hypothetical protein